MMKLKKSIGRYLCLLTAVLGCISAIFFFAIDIGDVTFSMATFVLVLAGSATAGIAAFANKHILLAFMSALLFAVACGFHIYTITPSLTDIVTKVNLYDGNNAAAIIFGSLFVICELLLIVACFIGTNDKIK